MHSLTGAPLQLLTSMATYRPHLLPLPAPLPLLCATVPRRTLEVFPTRVRLASSVPVIIDEPALVRYPSIVCDQHCPGKSYFIAEPRVSASIADILLRMLPGDVGNLPLWVFSYS